MQEKPLPRSQLQSTLILDSFPTGLTQGHSHGFLLWAPPVPDFPLTLSLPARSQGVGLGSDFDGIEVTPAGMEDAGHFYKIFDELRERGYTETDLEKIAGGNFLRILECCAGA